MKVSRRCFVPVVLAALPSFACAQEYFTNLTTGTLTLSAAANWEDANVLTNAATDLRFFVNSAATDLSLSGAYVINNDLTGLTLSNLTLDGQSAGGGRSVTISGNPIALSAGASLVLGNQGSSGGNAFGYTISAPVTLNGGLSLSGSPANAGSVSFSSVTLPASDVEFASSSSNRVSLVGGTLAGNYTFSGSGTGGFTLGGTLTLSGNRILTVNGATSPILGGTIDDGLGSFSITKEGNGVLSLAGANHTFDGGVTVNAGTLSLIAAGATVNHSPGGITVNNGAAVRLEWSGTPSGSVNTSAIAYGSTGGRFEFGNTGGGNAATVTYAGDFTGSGVLEIVARGGKDSILFSGDNSAYAGSIRVTSATPYSPTMAQVVSFEDVDAVFGSDGTPAFDVSAGAKIGFSTLMTATTLSPYSFGDFGGIALQGTAGALDSSISSPFSLLGVGGGIILNSRDSSLSNRIADSSVLSMAGQSLQIIGRNANDSPIAEVVASVSVSGGSHLFLNRSSSDSSGTGSGVSLIAGSLSVASGPGNTLQIQTGTSGDFGNPSGAGVNAVTVTGSKPSVTNGIISPGVQHFIGGNNLGSFVTFSGDNLVQASYTNYSNVRTTTSDPTTVSFTPGSSTEVASLSSTASPTNLTGGAATWQLSGESAVYAIRLAAGNLNLGGNKLTISGGGLIMTSATISNGTLDFGESAAFVGAYNSASQGTISAKISGSGGLTVMGTSQSLNITNTTNNFTGGLYVNGGVVAVQGSSINENDVVVGPYGRLVLGAATGSAATVGGVSGTGVVSTWVAGSGSSTVTSTISPASGVHNFEGLVSDGAAGRVMGLIKSGLGTQVFSGIGIYTGTTTVTNGLLRIDGDFSAATGNVSVTGGTLGGTGTIGGATTIGTLGTLAPGASPGLLTFGSSLALGGAAIFELDGATRGAGGYDAVDVGGLLTYGGELTIDVGFTLVDPLYTFDLFSFGSQTGTFSQVTLAGNQAGTLTSGNAWTTQSGGYNWTFDFASGDLTAAVVPEPATYAALAGLLVLAVAARRRRQLRG